VKERFVKIYKSCKVGDPFDDANHAGPLVDAKAVKAYVAGISTIKSQGGKILFGGNARPDLGPCYVEPTIVEIDHKAPIVQEELFLPILYLVKFTTFEEAVKLNNRVPQGLVSSIFTNNVKNYMKWIGPLGADSAMIYGN